MWLRNPEKYARRYFYGEKDSKSQYMALGSRVADALDGEKTEDDILQMLCSLIPRYENPEYEIKVIFKTEDGEVDLLGKIDSFNPSPLKFLEYKTGRVPWTQRRAEGHKQLDHYAAMIWLQKKRIPEISLIWAQTDFKESGELDLTGKIKTFKVKKTLGDILEYLALVSRVAHEIEEAYNKELNKIS